MVGPLCNVSAPPTPPDPVTNITIIQFTVPDHRHAHLKAQWSPPLPYGNQLTQYQVWIGRRETEREREIGIGREKSKRAVMISFRFCQQLGVGELSQVSNWLVYLFLILINSIINNYFIRCVCVCGLDILVMVV